MTEHGIKRPETAAGHFGNYRQTSRLGGYFLLSEGSEKKNSVLMAGNKTSVRGPLLVGVRRGNFYAIYTRDRYHGFFYV